MRKLTVTPLDEVYVTIHGDKSAEIKLWEDFTFMVPGYQHMPKYRTGTWDGKIRLYNGSNGRIYKGLLPRIEQWAEKNQVELEFLVDVQDESFSIQQAKEFAESLDMSLVARPYQLEGFAKSVRKRRCLLISPTASGKSLMYYMLIRFFNMKTLLIVPTTNLVGQMTEDFVDYSKGTFTDVHQIMAGRSKDSTELVVVSTWQSIYKQPPEWFDQFECIMGDEVHQFKATSLKAIMSNAKNVVYRIGMTGTLDGTVTHQLVLEGLFGKKSTLTTTKELIAKKYIAPIEVKAIILKYEPWLAKEQARTKYQDEIQFLVNTPERTQFISNLSLSLKGNTLVLFAFIVHGKAIHELITKADPNRKVFLIYGKVKADVRNEVRKIVEGESNAIIVASYGTFSTGANIRNIHNIIAASPYKSRIRILQSIGRGLRLKDNKGHLTWFDIADDLRHLTWTNYSVRHYAERVSIYHKQEFPFKQYKVRIKCKRQPEQGILSLPTVKT